MTIKFADGKLVFILEEDLDAAATRRMAEATLAFRDPEVVIDLRGARHINSFALFDLVAWLKALSCRFEFRGAGQVQEPVLEYLNLQFA